MSKFFEALSQHTIPGNQSAEQEAPPTEQSGNAKVRELNVPEPAPIAISGVPSPDPVPVLLSRTEGIRHLTERMAPLARSKGDLRVLIAGCAPGDGSSSVAGAIAIDMSQRLGVRTLLVDGNLQRPRILKMFASQNRLSESEPGNPAHIRPSRWLRLHAASIDPWVGRDEEAAQFDELSSAMQGFAISLVDAGTVRLDSSMLRLVRSNDAVLLVVRSGYTERRQLATTASSLAGLDAPVTGVVINAVIPATPRWIRRLLGEGN